MAGPRRGALPPAARPAQPAAADRVSAALMGSFLLLAADIRPLDWQRLTQKRRRAEKAGHFACAHCGQARELPRGGTAACSMCASEECLPACEDRRAA